MFAGGLNFAVENAIKLNSVELLSTLVANYVNIMNIAILESEEKTHPNTPGTQVAVTERLS